MQRNTWQRVLLWVATLGLMAGIYAFSAQPGEQSYALTEAAVLPLTELIADMQSGADEHTVAQLLIVLGTLARKLAHFAEYALLGLLLHLLCVNHGCRRLSLPMLLGAAYAATDEWHQSFVPGRLGTPLDVLLDAAGVATGVLLIHLIRRIRRRKHVHDS